MYEGLSLAFYFHNFSNTCEEIMMEIESLIMLEFI